MIEKIKIILSIFLMVFIVIPLGSCERKQLVSVDDVISNQSVQSQREDLKSSKDYLIPISEFSPSNISSWPLIFIFAWFLPFNILKRKFLKKGQRKNIATTFEVLLTAYSTFCIYSLILFLWYKPTVSGYLSLITITLYCFLLLAEIRQNLLKNITKAST
ncbi:MAG: hypothetical protein OEL87_02300 [Nanoarchaeota archaeon]|nr:hypothetical protein [Nanoarchaeota archaeon]